MAETIHTTVLFIVQEQQVLLAMKKRGMGAGRWNGAGGKIDSGETPEQACIRECQEELLITPHDIRKVAVHRFELGGQDLINICHTFVANGYDGTATETEEMAPRWFSLAQVPYHEMWHDDIYWLPAILAGRKIQTHIIFDDQDMMTSMQIVEAKHL